MPRTSQSSGNVTTVEVAQPVTDDSVRVRHLAHYQFSWIAQEPSEAGVCDFPTGAGPRCM